MRRYSKKKPKDPETALKQMQQNTADQIAHSEKIHSAMTRKRSRPARENNAARRQRQSAQRKAQQGTLANVHAQLQAQVANRNEGAKKSLALVGLAKELAAAKKKYEITKKAHLANKNDVTRTKRIEALKAYQAVYSRFKDERRHLLQQNVTKSAAGTSVPNTNVVEQTKKSPVDAVRKQRTSEPGARQSAKGPITEDKRLIDLDRKIITAENSLAKAYRTDQNARHEYMKHLIITGYSNTPLFEKMNAKHDAYLQGYKDLLEVKRERASLKEELSAPTNSSTTQKFRTHMSEMRNGAASQKQGSDAELIQREEHSPKM